MPNGTVSITIDNVIDAIAAFLGPFIGAATIARGQQNRVAPPPAPYVLLTEILRVPLETPTTTWTSDTLTITTPARIDIQVDFQGDSAGDQASAVDTVWRTSYTCDQFSGGLAPLTCSGPMQAPRITGESQYEDRWTLTLSLQYNPIVTLPQQSADTLSMHLVEEIP